MGAIDSEIKLFLQIEWDMGENGLKENWWEIGLGEKRWEKWDFSPTPTPFFPSSHSIFSHFRFSHSHFSHLFSHISHQFSSNPISPVSHYLFSHPFPPTPFSHTIFSRFRFSHLFCQTPFPPLPFSPISNSPFPPPTFLSCFRKGWEMEEKG